MTTPTIFEQNAYDYIFERKVLVLVLDVPTILWLVCMYVWCMVCVVMSAWFQNVGSVGWTWPALILFVCRKVFLESICFVVPLTQCTCGAAVSASVGSQLGRSRWVRGVCRFFASRHRWMPY